MSARIQLLLDQPFTELHGEGWAMGKGASDLQFCQSVTPPGGGDASFVPVGDPKHFYRVPGLGVIIRKYRTLAEGIVAYDDPLSDAWKQAEVDIALDSDGHEALRIYGKSGTLARRAVSPDAGFITLGGAIFSNGLTALSDHLGVIWQTRAALAANEGWSVTAQPVRTFDDHGSKSHCAITFGNRYILGINLQGSAVLSENVGGSSPNWITRKTMNLGGGVSLREPFSVSCIPIGGRYMLFTFGAVRGTDRASRFTSFARDREFAFDVRDEGSGTPYDSGIDQYVAIPPGKLGIAVNSSGTDYRFLPSRVRYPATPETVYFSPEPLKNPLPGQTPTLTPKGYAGGYTSGGGGTMTLDYVNGLGGAWNPPTSKNLVPKLTMAGSANGIYTPELWYIEGRADPTTYVPPYTPYDASGEWTYIRFQKTCKHEATQITVKLNEENRVGYLYRRGGPVRLKVDGLNVFDGYFLTRKPALAPGTMEAEYEGVGMEDRLHVPFSAFEPLDGKKLSDIVYRLLRRAGFTDGQIVIYDDLGGFTLEQFAEPQTLKLYDVGVTVDEALADLLDKCAFQGVETLRVIWNGASWQCYFVDYGRTGPDPAIVLNASPYVGPQGSDASRWAAGWFNITSLLEWDVRNPDYNALAMTLTQGRGEAGGKIEAYVAPPAAVLEDPTSQMFEGRYRLLTISSPEVTATTRPGLLVRTRARYDRDCRNVVALGVQAEWGPSIAADMQCAVVGVNPVTGQTVSFGVFRIESFDAEISADERPETPTQVYLRSWEWSAGYRLRYLRPTSSGFTGGGDVAIPMYDGVLPPPAYLTEGVNG